jgi:hypothetical protein
MIIIGSDFILLVIMFQDNMPGLRGVQPIHSYSEDKVVR